MIKNLENKYIDLANYYKEAAREKGAIHSYKIGDQTEENMMIRELIDQKRELEDNIQNMKHIIA